MTHSKRYKWQARWIVNSERTEAKHETGLIVRLTNEGRSVHNAEQVRADLAVKNGHNAAAMVQRLTKEGCDLLEGRSRVYNQPA